MTRVEVAQKLLHKSRLLGRFWFVKEKFRALFFIVVPGRSGEHRVDPATWSAKSEALLFLRTLPTFTQCHIAHEISSTSFLVGPYETVKPATRTFVRTSARSFKRS